MGFLVSGVWQEIATRHPMSDQRTFLLLLTGMSMQAVCLD